MSYFCLRVSTEVASTVNELRMNKNNIWLRQTSYSSFPKKQTK